MTRFIFVTDLHGWTTGYEMTLHLALEEGISIIVNGGDMFPGQEPMHLMQEMFLEEFFAAHVELCRAEGVQYWSMFGNDDLSVLEKRWKKMVDENENLHDLTAGWAILDGNGGSEEEDNGGDTGGILIRGLSFVPDHPFGLKDWSVLDSRGWRRPPQRGRPVVSATEDFAEIGEVEIFFAERPTMEELLAEISGTRPAGRQSHHILLAHGPPSGLGLATIGSGVDVGSAALRSWIETHQPLLTLHGHIHESVAMTGVHTANLGRTVCHQPGQAGPEALNASVITIEDDGRVQVNWRLEER